MPRKVPKEEKLRPKYLNADGTLDFDKIFKFQEKQTELLRNTSRDGTTYVMPVAPQCLSVGGIRSGKTSGWLMYLVFNYCLAFEKCDILVLRRTFKELESGAIADFKTFVPPELYTYNPTSHVATFVNGSRVVFGHCLAKGTLVTTQRGLVPIEQVTTDDLALTRKGLRRILWSGQTGIKPVIKFGTVSATEDHKFFVNGQWMSYKEIKRQKSPESSLLIHGPSYFKSLEHNFPVRYQKDDFMALTVELPLEETSECVPVYDLQVEEEHEFFANGILVHNCQNNKERDIEQYLGQAYPGILVDECGQFSPEAWMMLYSRNTVNASCISKIVNGKEHLPIPCIIGATNPLGPHYEYYRTVFVQKEPWQKPEDAKKDINGAWWVLEAGEWRCVYDPKMFAFQRSTVMDNPELLKRDPGILARLNSYPAAKRNKLLLGLDGVAEGQYFDVFSEDYHVVNLREDPDAIIWQPYQSVWASQDWGMGHHNAAYLFTTALVKMVNGDYKSKTVCFKELVTSGGKTHKEWAAMLAHMSRVLPDEAKTPIKLKAIYFSHEKFSRVMDSHTPADEYSRELRSLGLPAVTRGTTDRVGSASLMYNMLKNGELVILDTCKDIIQAIPSLMRNPDMMDDVLKVDNKGDDAYDGFRLGLYGQLAKRKKPKEEDIQEHANSLDPLARHFYLLKIAADKVKATAVFVQSKVPTWESKLQNF
jgi:hypothetical protein